MDPPRGASDGPRAGEPPVRVRRIAELLAAARAHLEDRFTDFWVEGEISDVMRASTGHVYFTLVEPGAQVRGVMFRADALRARAKLVPGAKVRLRASVTIYEAKGQFQLVARVALPAGEGDAALELERLRKKLAAEGLFAEARKRALPRVPRVVGLVTSAEGAALGDVVRVARGRMPVRIVLSPSPVQGPDAPPLLVRALRALESVEGLDVVIVARGGGASEDLAAFNDERVARAIVACPVPVVCGVGHEIDVTLADLCADARAATPSNAAELVVPDARALEGEVAAASRRVERALDVLVESAHARLARTERRLGDPRRLVAHTHQAFEARERALEQSLRRRLATARAALGATASALDRSEPRRRLSTQRAAVERELARVVASTHARLAALARQREADAERGARALERALARRRAALATLAASLEALSPLRVLGRGYAIALHARSGRALVRATDARAGDAVRVRLAEGELETEVRVVRSSEPER